MKPSIGPLGKLGSLFSNPTSFQLMHKQVLTCLRGGPILSLPLLLITISTLGGFLTLWEIRPTYLFLSGAEAVVPCERDTPNFFNVAVTRDDMQFFFLLEPSSFALTVSYRLEL